LEKVLNKNEADKMREAAQRSSLDGI